MDKADKIKLVISLVFRLLLVTAAIISAVKHDWIDVGTSILTLFLTFLPSILEKKFRVDFPGEFEIVILLFIYASIYLGDLHAFYLKFWWWDIMLHSLSGIIFGIIGFSLIYILNRSNRCAVQLSPGFVAFFAFCFAMALGALWEIYEFLMDVLLDLKMQRFGLVDTMYDLILDFFSALLTSLVGYLYLRKRALFLDRLVKRFVKLNPSLFRKRHG